MKTNIAAIGMLFFLAACSSPESGEVSLEMRTDTVRTFDRPVLSEAEADREWAVLEGRWLPASALLYGRPLPDSSLNATTLTLENGRFHTEVNDLTDDGSITLREGSGFRTMELAGDAGINAGKTLHAIYRIEGDSLTISYGLNPDQRPVDFTSTPENAQYVVVYRRAR